MPNELETLLFSYVTSAPTTRTNAFDLIDRHGVDPNVEDEIGTTPIFMAVDNDDSHTIEGLVERGAKVNVQDFNDETPVHKAAKNQCLDALRVLARRGADLHAKNDEGLTAAALALQKDNGLAVLDALIEEGLDLREELENMSLSERPPQAGLPFVAIRFCQNGSEDLRTQNNFPPVMDRIEKAAKNHEDPRWRGFLEQVRERLLIEACRRRDTVTVRDLLDRGTDPFTSRLSDLFGGNVLVMVSDNDPSSADDDQVTLLHMLLKHEVSVTDTTPSRDADHPVTLLDRAATSFNAEELEELLEKEPVDRHHLTQALCNMLEQYVLTYPPMAGIQDPDILQDHQAKAELLVDAGAYADMPISRSGRDLPVNAAELAAALDDGLATVRMFRDKGADVTGGRNDRHIAARVLTECAPDSVDGLIDLDVDLSDLYCREDDVPSYVTNAGWAIDLAKQNVRHGKRMAETVTRILETSQNANQVSGSPDPDQVSDNPLTTGVKPF